MITQEIEVKSTLFLDDLKLDMDKDITIYCKDESDEVRTLKIANVEGKIVIFADEELNVDLNKWEGIVPYKKRIMEVYDEML